MGIFGRIADIFKARQKHLSDEEIQAFENQRQLNILPENIGYFYPKKMGLSYWNTDTTPMFIFDIMIDEQGLMRGVFVNEERIKVKIEEQLSENQILDLRFILAYYNFFEIKSEKWLDSTNLQDYSLCAENQAGKDNKIVAHNDWIYFRPIQNALIEDIITCLQIRKYYA